MVIERCQESEQNDIGRHVCDQQRSESAFIMLFEMKGEGKRLVDGGILDQERLRQ